MRSDKCLRERVDLAGLAAVEFGILSIVKDDKSFLRPSIILSSDFQFP